MTKRSPWPGGTTRLRTGAIVVGVIALAALAGAAVRPLVQPVASSADSAVTAVPTSSPIPPATTAPTSAPPTQVPATQAPPAPAPAAQPTTDPEVALPPLAPQLQPFAGLSTWIDIYDLDLTPAEQIERAAAGGVELIFVQTARHKSTRDVEEPGRLGQILELAHDRGMKVMTWYVPDFVHDRRDLRRSKVAMGFTSPRGDQPDAFGLDIEIEDNPDPADRSRRLIALSQALRGWAGPDFPLAAIVLPPLQLDLRGDWWPNFPFAELRSSYDVYIPMSYSSFRGTDKRTTYRWNVGNVVEMRNRTGDPALPVHLAGGIADNFPEVGTFVRAVRDSNSIGGGLYDLHTTHPQAWPILRRLRAQPES